jgi:N-acetylglucosamine-6-phosphate deacetylase
MSAFVIDNVRVVRPGVGIEPGSVHVRDGEIVPRGTGVGSIDGQGGLLSPGLIDVHTHGIHRFAYDQGVDDLHEAAQVLARYGTTTVVPTLVPMVTPEFMEGLSIFVSAIDEIKGVSIPGVHLEGPFVAITGAACETRDGDVTLLDELLDAAGGRVTVMSIAPDVPNILPVIERLVERGVTPFITHTKASVEQTLAAIDTGARHATHFYDVFPVPDETDPGVRPVGVVETILGDPRTTCDFIADGIHVHPMAIKAAVAALGWERVSLITDASFGAGLPPGDYDTPWGYPVRVEPGNAPRIADPDHPLVGGLAGSALTMNKGLMNLLTWIDRPPDQVWAMATRNPAQAIGLERKGHIEPGANADLVLWDDTDGQLTALCTWVGGEVVYRSEEFEKYV